MSWIRIALLGSVAVLLAAPSAAAQDPEELAERFAAAWESGSVRSVVSLLAPDGVRLRLEDQGYGGVEIRRVAAALESYWEGRRTIEVLVSRVALMDRQPSTAYAELDWKGVSDVTGERFGATIFLGLSTGDEGWRVEEIRTIRPR